MTDQVNTQVLNAGKRFAEAAFKAQTIAFQGFEKALGLQLKAFENSVNSAFDFVNEASAVKQPEGFKALLPKSSTLLRESAEQTYATAQELVNVGVNTSEALTNLVKAEFEAANDSVSAKPASAKAK